MHLIVGLGNPGKKYHNTHHNLGFMCIDFLSQSNNIVVNKIKHSSICGEGSISGQKVVLAKPQTYMNLSGESVRDIVQWYKIPQESIIIIYDDVNLELGKIRIREKGSHGGHNGLKSIIYQLNTDIFPRIRIGIGKPEDVELTDYVLSKVSDPEKEILFNSIKNAGQAVQMIINGDIQKAMAEFN